MDNAITSTDDREKVPPGCLIYVTPDCTDSAVQKRVRGFLNEGVALVSFSFRRTRYNEEFVPDWPNIELGKTTERKLLKRISVFLQALRIFHRHRHMWRSAALIYARNLDLALLAMFGKVVTRSRAPLVYEALDIHPALTVRGIRGTLLRWLERRVLARCHLLVVSSPAFLRNYFQPMQRYNGQSFLLENKWPSQQMSQLPRQIPYTITEPEPQWTIGWFGNIRCAKSLEILTELADALPDRVRIYLRGWVSLLGEQKLMDVICQRDNMVYDGQYVAPTEFPDIYSKVHFNWCVDLDDGDNSLWLIPNRLYEGGYFGIPALAIAAHETGRVVRQRGLGLTLESPVADHLKSLFAKMTSDDYAVMRRGIESLPESCFVDHGDIARLLDMASFGGTHPPAGSGQLESSPTADQARQMQK